MLPDLSRPLDENDRRRAQDNAAQASEFLKAIGHQGRLMILCSLVSGPKSVGALEEILGIRQAALSQQLARLRAENLVVPERSGKQVIYSLADDRTRRVLELVYELFCR